MNRRSILAAYKKKSSHLQTGVTGFKSGNLFKIVRAVAVVQNRKNRAADIVHGDILHQNICNTPALGAFQLDALAPDIAHRAVGDNHAGNLADGL